MSGHKFSESFPPVEEETETPLETGVIRLKQSVFHLQHLDENTGWTQQHSVIVYIVLVIFSAHPSLVV